MRLLSPSKTIRPRWILVFLALLITSPLLAAELTSLRPLGQVEQVPIGKDKKIYLEVGAEAVKVPVTGPGVITGYARASLPTDATDPVAGTLHFAGIPSVTADLPLQFRPSRRASWGDKRPGVPSGGRKFVIDVPEGAFTLEITGEAVGGDPLMVIMYYDGPPQPSVPGLMPAVAVEAAAPKKKKGKSKFSFRGNASIDMIYNSNVLSNSPEYNADFVGGSYPWKFANPTKDDLVIAPGFDVETRANLFSLGQSRFKFKFKRWHYSTNPIKTNTDFHFYLRQLFGKKQSLEFYFHFAPEQYIRQLSDRPPGSDPSDPITWTDFSFQRNVWNFTWRQNVGKKINYLLLYEHNYRYYNQPFMENDITAWEVRGSVGWKISKVVKLNLDYSYESAQARGVDEPGEDPEDSDNSDGSYDRDLYRIGLDIRSKSFKPVIDRLSVSFLFMDYYYTTEKSLVQDPYHAGRRDMFYKGTVEVRRKLSKPITLKVAVRRTERVVDSPWEGDITTDKDFTQWLFWFSLNYRF